MTEIAVRVAGPADTGAVEGALTGGGDGRSCQCQWWTLTAAEWSGTTRDTRADLLRAEASPGLVAYVDDEPAGWVRAGPRSLLPRLARTRAYAAVATQPWDDPTVWAVSCFVVRRERRGAGLTAALLAAAVASARAAGARLVEGYPIDVAAAAGADGRVGANELFHGALTTFLDAGFVVLGRTTPARPVVGLRLG